MVGTTVSRTSFEDTGRGTCRLEPSACTGPPVEAVESARMSAEKVVGRGYFGPKWGKTDVWIFFYFI